MTMAERPDQSSALDPRAENTPPRRTDIDGLRIIICGGVLLSHALLIFAAEPRYHLKSPEPSLTASIFYEFTRITTMPAFFVIAGWSALLALRRRSSGPFVKERAERLLVPLVGGIVLFGSIIKYIELRQGIDLGLHGLRHIAPLQIDFFEFFPRNLRRISQITWSHLWFLVYLFLISVLLLPLLLRLARSAPRTTLPAAATAYFPGLVLAVWLATFNGYWPYLPNLLTDWANFSYFALCFAIGAEIAVWPGFEARLRAEAPRLLALMLGAFAGVILCGESTVGRLFVGLTAWGATGAGLGFAARINPSATPRFVYLSEATLPVYILHLVPTLLLGIVLLPLPLPVWVKIVLICLGAAAISLASYHWLIRPWAATRWLMGMRARPPSQAAATARLAPE